MRALVVLEEPWAGEQLGLPGPFDIHSSSALFTQVSGQWISESENEVIIKQCCVLGTVIEL